MNSRPLSREEMLSLWFCLEVMIDGSKDGKDAAFQRGVNILSSPDLMTETLCAERLAKNNPFEQLEDVNGY